MTDTIYWLYVALAVATFGVFHGATLFWFRRDAKALPAYGRMQIVILAAAALALIEAYFRHAERHEGQTLAIVLILASQAIFWWTIASHRESRPALVFFDTPGSVVVTYGPYRFVRHPFYLSYLLGWASLAAFTLSWIHVAVVALMVALYVRAARGEEQRLLASPIGATYAEYRQRTGMFLPRTFRKRG